jgi:hypothetical protein
VNVQAAAFTTLTCQLDVGHTAPHAWESQVGAGQITIGGKADARMNLNLEFGNQRGPFAEDIRTFRRPDSLVLRAPNVLLIPQLYRPGPLTADTTSNVLPYMCCTL